MGGLPIVSGREAVKRFEKIGYKFVRQRGSHMRLIHPSNPARIPLSIPDSKEVKRGLLRKLLRDAKISVKEFEELK